MEGRRRLWGREERWIKHYSSAHEILLVGEGDFSFSTSLAVAFGSATNIFATSLDSYDELIKKYKNAQANLVTLQILGASLLHGVDATRMKILPQFQWRKFHRIIYNFPHAGFYGSESNPDLITIHRNLVRGFLWNARSMLCPGGEIHINHKIKAPFDSWRIEDLGSECLLVFAGLDDFKIEDYPGYANKRGSGSRSDDPFPLGECRTFKFKLPITEAGREFYSMQTIQPNFQIPISTQLFPSQFDRQPPVGPYKFNDVYLSNGMTSHIDYTKECHRIFGDYLKHVEETFGSTSYDVHRCVGEALRVGFEVYMRGAPGRPPGGYIDVLEVLHDLSILRTGQLRKMLYSLDHQQC